VTLLIAKKSRASVRNGPDGWPGSDVESYLRRTDLPALLRDGSLGVILPHTAHYTDVQRRITEALGSLDASIGLATFPKDGEDVSSLLRAADLAAEQNRAREASQRLAA
jgi:GGDEF domain-containing protein